MFNFIRGVVGVATFGIINPDKQGNITLKDPITGIVDIAKNTTDAILRDKDQGVWIGIRNISGSFLGYSSAVLRIFNSDLVHQAIMVDGQSFSLNNDKGGHIRIVKESSYEKNQYNWIYKGETKRKIEDIIKAINIAQEEYDVILQNCQDVSQSLAHYAMGNYDWELCLEMSFFHIEGEVVEVLAIILGGRVLLRTFSDVRALISS